VHVPHLRGGDTASASVPASPDAFTSSPMPHGPILTHGPLSTRGGHGGGAGGGGATAVACPDSLPGLATTVALLALNQHLFRLSV
jgi:hypothetical protein